MNGSKGTDVERRVSGARSPYVFSCVLDPDSIPFDRPPHFALHSREAAAYVAKSLADAFTATAGAVE